MSQNQLILDFKCRVSTLTTLKVYKNRIEK